MAGRRCASKGHGCRRKATLTPHFPLALTAQHFSVPYTACRALSPNKMPLHTSICPQGPWERLRHFPHGMPCHGAAVGVSAKQRALPLPRGLPSPAWPPPCTCLTGPRARRPRLLSHTSRQHSCCSCLHGLPLPSLLFSRFLSSALPYGSS